jgi:ABC-type transport system substrate-binding protein
VKAKFQFLFIAIVIILILIGETMVYVPQRSIGATVVIKSYPSTNALVQAVTNGQVDIAPLQNVAPQTLLQLKNDPNLSIIPIGNFGFTYIGLNLRNSPLNNSVFREAMLYGFNRERVLSDALAGYGEILNPGLFSSAYAALGWRNESVDSYPYDPAKASKLLDSIGFTQTSTGIRVDSSTGQQLRTMFIFSKLTDPQAVAAANMFAEDMQAIGLPIISFPETDIDFHSQVSVTYYFDLYIQTESANAAPTWLYDLFAGVNNIYPAPLSTNLVGYDSSTFNQCAGQLMTASNSDSAKAAALKCQEELSLDLPAFPVYSKNLLIVEHKASFNITPITGSISDTIAASVANMTGGSLVRIGEVGGLTDINPAISLGAADSLALRLITAPLLRYGMDGLLLPGLVDQWQMSDNATSLTLDLRRGASFQDGSPTTSHDLAATLNWLVTNMLPSSPLYPIMKTIRNITEVDAYTITISLSQSNSFAIYEIGNLFALHANWLPQSNGPLALLLSGALQSSGPFELARFVQGVEADLEYAPSSEGSRLLTLTGVQGQDVFGFPVGGSELQIRSEPLSYGGQSIENSTFTARIQNGNATIEIPGTYMGFGIYQANLNLNGEGISLGKHLVTTELYGQFPSGVILQFDQQILTIHQPWFLGQIIVYLLGVVAVGFIAYSAALRKRKIARRRVRRGRRTSARRPRRRR